MTTNRSLDEFAGGGGASASDEDSDSGGSGEGPVDDRDEDEGVADVGEVDGAAPSAALEAEGSDETPGVSDGAGVASTYVWTPGGGECSACGAPAEERWRDDDGLVCPDCKEW